MKAYKARLLVEEFPFLNDLLWQEHGRNPLSLTQHVDEIVIRRCTEEVLSQTPYDHSYSWTGGGYHHYQHVYAVWVNVDPDTRERSFETYELESSVDCSNGSGQWDNWNALSIGDQLQIGGTPNYLVSCVKQDHDANGHGQVSRSWTIYKMSAFDSVSYLLGKVDEAAAALKAEIAAACS